MARRPTRTTAAPPRRREQKARISTDVARRVRDGHPWIFSSALKGRDLPGEEGKCVDVVDEEGRFAGRAILEPGGRPVLRVFCKSPGQELNSMYVDQAVERCIRARRRLLQPGPLDCYRLVNGDSEGLPGVTVDRYADYLVVCQFTPLARVYQDDLLDVLRYRLAPRGIYLQRRFAPPAAGQPRPGAELMHGEAAPHELLVTEGQFRFFVDVTAPVGTGLFPDMRRGRRVVADLAGGRRVLNCFSYTGAFSVVAAASGARQVVSVDSAPRAHARARRNMTANGMDPEGERLEFVTGDAMAIMSRLESRDRRFELIIADPPTFSTVKGKAFNASKDYADLVASALPLVKEGGQMLLACNASRMMPQDLDRAVGVGATRANRNVLVIRRLDQPEDYPVLPAFSEGQHLKILLLQVD